MGINANNKKMLEEVVFQVLPPKFEVYELGNQMVRDTGGDYPAEDFYRLQGCGRYDCIDINGEGTINLDLNKPVEDMEPRDLVTDFGTSEHCFNIGICWENIFALCKVNGIVVFEKIIHGYRDHGLYNIQPTLISSIVSDNGYEQFYEATSEDKHGVRLYGAIRKTNPDFKIPTQERYREMIHGTGKSPR